MVKPDWDAPEFSLPEPGWYHVEVSQAEARCGKCDYYNVRLGEVGTNRGIAFDNILLNGKGAGMGISKLKALGVPIGSDVSPEDLNGKRAWVCIVHDEYTKDGKKKQKTAVDTYARDSHCGYLSEDEYKQRASTLAPIDNWKRTDGAKAPLDDTPF